MEKLNTYKYSFTVLTTVGMTIIFHLQRQRGLKLRQGLKVTAVTFNPVHMVVHSKQRRSIRH